MIESTFSFIKKWGFWTLLRGKPDRSTPFSVQIQSWTYSALKSGRQLENIPGFQCYNMLKHDKNWLWININRFLSGPWKLNYSLIIGHFQDPDRSLYHGEEGRKSRPVLYYGEERRKRFQPIHQSILDCTQWVQFLLGLNVLVLFSFNSNVAN